MSNSKHLRIGWLTTANGDGSLGMFQAILEAIDSERLNGSIEFVFVNRARGQTAPTDRFLDLVVSREIPLVTLSSLRFRREHGNAPWRELRSDFDLTAIDMLSDFDPDVTVQAGYMLYAPILCERFLMLNQHPALPGGTIGMWQDAVWDVIQNQDAETGSMIHLSTSELDRGPVASLCRFSVRGPEFDPLWNDVACLDIKQLRADRTEELPLFKAIRAAGLLRERPLVVETLQAVTEGLIDLNSLECDDSFQPLDLTESVENAVATA